MGQTKQVSAHKCSVFLVSVIGTCMYTHMAYPKYLGESFKLALLFENIAVVKGGKRDGV